MNSENGTTITRIPDRNKMYQGLTPQSFRRVDYIDESGIKAHTGSV